MISWWNFCTALFAKQIFFVRCPLSLLLKGFLSACNNLQSKRIHYRVKVNLFVTCSFKSLCQMFFCSAAAAGGYGGGDFEEILYHHEQCPRKWQEGWISSSDLYCRCIRAHKKPSKPAPALRDAGRRATIKKKKIKLLFTVLSLSPVARGPHSGSAKVIC